MELAVGSLPPICKSSPSAFPALQTCCHNGPIAKCQRLQQPLSLTYHLITAQAGLVAALPDWERQQLTGHGALPKASSVRGRTCVMCPVRSGSPRLMPCCLCENWCHVSCSYQTHLRIGKSLPVSHQNVGSEEEIIVLSHPYLEDYVVLPTSSAVRIGTLKRWTQGSIQRLVNLSLVRVDMDQWPDREACLALSGPCVEPRSRRVLCAGKAC